MIDRQKVHISIFGTLDFRIGGVSKRPGITGPTRSLLQYLLCFHGRPTRRELLLETFWPETRPERRRSSLNSALWRIKKALKAYPPLAVDASAECVRLTGTGAEGVDVDFIRLETTLRAFGDDPSDPACLRGLLAALDECEATPLDGLDDDWAAIERERLCGLRMRALTEAMHGLAAARRYDDALEIGRRILVKEPYRESAVQEVLCLHVLNGQRARALQVFEEFRTALARELGIEPMGETRALRDYLADDRAPGQRRGPGEAGTLMQCASRPGIDALIGTIEHSRATLGGTRRLPAIA